MGYFIEGGKIWMRHKFPVDKRKIVNSKTFPENLELRIIEWHSHIGIEFVLSGSSESHPIQRFDCQKKDDAEKAYREITRRLRIGNYKLDIYENGKAQIKFD